MQSDSNVANLKPLAIDIRFWQLAKQMSIQRLEDAIVELVSNMDDAYIRMGSNDELEKKFYIEVYGLNATKLRFIDNATGMTSSQMESKLMSVGGYKFSNNEDENTNDEQSVRGYFSRGTKDVTVVGDLYFESIRNDLYSKCVITTNGQTGFITRDMVVTQEIRGKINIPVNGMCVTIHVSDAFRVSNPDILYKNVIDNVALRDIMANERNYIQATLFYDLEGKIVVKQSRVGYKWPSYKEKVFDKHFEVPNYPGVMAHFVLYRCETKLPDSNFDSELEYGLLIRSAKAIHECTLLRPQWRYHIAMPFLYGFIKCDYIMNLMYDIEENGGSPQNPFSVLDPSRKHGVNVDHPFIKNLYSIPGALMESYLPIVSDIIDDSFLMEGNIQSLIENLQIFGSELLTNDHDFMEWNSNDQGTLVRALRDIDRQYVTAENDTYPLHSKSLLNENMNQLTQNGPIEIIANTKPNDIEYEKLNIIEHGFLIPPSPITETENRDVNDTLISYVQNSKPCLKIKFSQAEKPSYQYSVYRTRGEVVLVLHLEYPLIKKHFKAQPSNNGVQIKVTKSNAIFLANIISEALSRLLLDTDHNVKEMKFHNLSVTETIHQVFSYYESKHNSIDKIIDDHIESYIATNENLFNE